MSGRKIKEKKKKTKDIVKEPTKKKGRADHLKEHQFKAGNKQGGRPKGSRNKLGEQFLKDFLAVWETDGRDALIDVRIKDPATFVRAAVAILPKELNIKHDVSEVEQLLEQFDIEELDQLITGITALGLKESGSKKKNKTTARSKSDSLH